MKRLVYLLLTLCLFSCGEKDNDHRKPIDINTIVGEWIQVKSESDSYKQGFIFNSNYTMSYYVINLDGSINYTHENISMEIKVFASDDINVPEGYKIYGIHLYNNQKATWKIEKQDNGTLYITGNINKPFDEYSVYERKVK